MILFETMHETCTYYFPYDLYWNPCPWRISMFELIYVPQIFKSKPWTTKNLFTNGNFHFSPRSQQRSLDLKFKCCLLSQIICERKVNFCWKRRGRLFHRSSFCGNDTFFRKTCGKLSILVIEKVIWNDLDSKMNLKLIVSKTS